MAETIRDAPSELIKACREHLVQEADQETHRLQVEAAVDPQVTIFEGDPEEAVKKAVQEQKADLVIIGRGRIQQTLGDCEIMRTRSSERHLVR